MWFTLGVQLLQDEDVVELETIKNNTAKLTERYLEMFKFWLNRKPEASWRKLIDGLKQIKQNSLAFDIEKLFSVQQTNEETGTVNQTLTSDHPTLGQHNNGGMSYIVIRLEYV